MLLTYMYKPVIAHTTPHHTTPILNKLPKILAPVFTCPFLLKVLLRACAESRNIFQRTRFFLFCFVLIPFSSFFLVLNYSDGFVEFMFMQVNKFASIFLKIRRVILSYFPSSLADCQTQLTSPKLITSQLYNWLMPKLRINPRLAV